jgi:hypothetical protein
MNSLIIGIGASAPSYTTPENPDFSVVDWLSYRTCDWSPWIHRSITAGSPSPKSHVPRPERRPRRTPPASICDDSGSDVVSPPRPSVPRHCGTAALSMFSNVPVIAAACCSPCSVTVPGVGTDAGRPGT